MTEDEAKEKWWCPFARVVGMQAGKVLFDQPSFNRMAEDGFAGKP